MTAHQRVIVLDFGAQYSQLIARRVRECSVYCELHPGTLSLEEIQALKPAAIIFESRCPGMDGTHIGKARWEWQDGKMIATSIAEGCKD